MKRVAVASMILSVGVIACSGDDGTSFGLFDDASDDVGVATDAGERDADATVDAADAADARDGATDATADASGDTLDEDVIPAPTEPSWCDGTTTHMYAPFEGTEIGLFPDGLLVRDDPSSPTGERLEITPETTPFYADAPPLVEAVAESMNVLSGFGRLGGALIRFDGPVTGLPTTPEESRSSSAWIWADLSTDPPTRIPFEAHVFDEGATVVLWPMIPLRLGAEHVIAVTTDAVTADGSCIAPAEATRALLFGDGAVGEQTARYDRVRPRYRAAIEALELEPAQISVASVFGTHDDLGPMRRAAAAIDAAPVAWGAWQGCEPRESMLQCETSTTVLDMRNERGLVDDTIEPTEAEVPVRVWLPPDAEGPVPVLVFGHGLQQDRGAGWLLASRLQGDGIAVVAMPAIKHGRHPSVTPDDPPQAVLSYLAIDIAALTIDAHALRGNFNQTNLDRLRLIRLLRTQPDLDGDGVDDIDPTRVAYVGASLGAVLGPALLALSPDLDAAALTIGGGRLVSLIRDQDQLEEEFEPLADLVLGPGQLNRLLPIAQHAIDPADPATWAPHVLNARFDGRIPPSVLMAVGLDDELFSWDSGNTLARAMGLPHVQPIFREVALLEEAGEPPVEGNAVAGTRTLGFFQYDRITQGEDPAPRRARHAASATSNESAAQLRAFLVAWAETGLPTIIDPFALLETAPRPTDW